MFYRAYRKHINSISSFVTKNFLVSTTVHSTLDRIALPSVTDRKHKSQEYFTRQFHQRIFLNGIPPAFRHTVCHVKALLERTHIFKLRIKHAFVNLSTDPHPPVSRRNTSPEKRGNKNLIKECHFAYNAGFVMQTLLTGDERVLCVGMLYGNAYSQNTDS